ncbi:hypothetical protein V8F06_014839, partial [Rhypophila decipiens]
YHRNKLPRSVIWFSPRHHTSIHSSIATPFPRAPQVGLGALGRLPLELLYEVLLCLDMRSIFKLRQTNLRSRQVVDSLRQYHLVVSHGLNLLCALLRTRLAIDVSLSDFFYALCTKACRFCGEFGGFISLLTWERSCFRCLQVAPETQVQTLSAARKQFHLSKVQLGQLRSFKTLPGRYTPEESTYKSHVTVVSAYQALLLSGQQPNSQTRAQLVNWGPQNPRFNFMGSCALPYYDGRTRRVEHGMSCGGCQLAVERDIYDSTVQLPDSEWTLAVRNKVYTQDGFLEHFRWCKLAQLLWKSSDQGNRQPPELPEVVRVKGYFGNRE